MLKHTVVISKETVKKYGMSYEKIHKVTYKFSPKPFKIYHRWDLPKKHEIEDWESEEDIWIKRYGMFYNVRDFLITGAPHIPGPYGGYQLALGEFAIVAIQGNIHSVSIIETKTI